MNWKEFLNIEIVEFGKFELLVGNLLAALAVTIVTVFVVLQEVLDENKNVLKAPQSFVRFTNFGDSSLDFELIFWSDSIFGINNLKSDLRRAIYSKLKEEGMEIPFPQRDVHLKGIESVPFQTQKD